MDSGEIALWIKIAYTAFAALVVLFYLAKYGPANFLWFSDIALVFTAIAVWLESPLLASMMAVGVFLPELLWNVSYFARLLMGMRISGLTDYMFDTKKPLFLRALSLFHVVVPVVLFWTLHQLGYDRRALVAQTVLAWIVLPLSYVASSPSKNINWVFGPGNEPQRRVPPMVYLGMLMIVFPLGVYLPIHLILMVLFEST